MDIKINYGLTQRLRYGCFPELGKIIRERREEFGYNRGELGARLAEFTFHKPSTGVHIARNIENGCMFGNRGSTPNPTQWWGKLEKTSVYLTALHFDEDDDVVIRLREYYEPHFKYPHPKREEILSRVTLVRKL